MKQCVNLPLSSITPAPGRVRVCSGKEAEVDEAKGPREYEINNAIDGPYLISNVEGKPIWYKSKRGSWGLKKMKRIVRLRLLMSRKTLSKCSVVR